MLLFKSPLHIDSLLRPISLCRCHYCFWFAVPGHCYTSWRLCPHCCHCLSHHCLLIFKIISWCRCCPVRHSPMPLLSQPVDCWFIFVEIVIECLPHCANASNPSILLMLLSVAEGWLLCFNSCYLLHREGVSNAPSSRPSICLHRRGCPPELQVRNLQSAPWRNPVCPPP